MIDSLLPGSSTAQAAEKAEVNHVLVTLHRSPLMARLFGYICEKYFAGESSQLSEIRIAAEVFGRSENFDRTQDAIVRVEAHRLRKRLRQYFAGPGADHAIQIELPTGSYVPVFRHVTTSAKMPVFPISEMDAPALEAIGEDSELAPESSPIERAAVQPLPPFKPDPLTDGSAVSPSPRRHWVWLAFPVALASASLILLTLRYRPSIVPAATPSQAAIVPAALPATGAIRLLCGYEGPPHIDDLGNAWGPDRFYRDGRPWSVRAGFIRRARDPFLFRNERTGEFSYDIPASPGDYELHLYFVETDYGEDLGGGENSRTMRIWLNGSELFQTFDPISDAGGPRIADERVFKDIQPGNDGKVHLTFQSQRGQPVLSALELLPGIPNATLPIRLVTQIGSYTDHSARIWAPDNYYMGGQIFGAKPPVSNTFDPGLFVTERAGNFSYAIPVDMRGTYTVRLYFAETYFGPENSGIGGIGSRIFNVMCNGVLLLDHFDIYKEAGGGAKALVKSFVGLKPNARGKLDFHFDPIANYASVFAIEVQTTRKNRDN